MSGCQVDLAPWGAGQCGGDLGRQADGLLCPHPCCPDQHWKPSAIGAAQCHLAKPAAPLLGLGTFRPPLGKGDTARAVFQTEHSQLSWV